MPRFVRNPTLAEDGLPQEMYLDVRRACERWLMKNDPFYADENNYKTWNKRHEQTSTTEGTHGNMPTSVDDNGCEKQ
jgi:hypothetical protein